MHIFTRLKQRRNLVIKVLKLHSVVVSLYLILIKPGFFAHFKTEECKGLAEGNVLRDLVPFVQFKKHEKHPWRSVNFNKVAFF